MDMGYEAIEHQGDIPPRMCTHCGDEDAEICCDGGTQEDGSHDEWAMCRKCCGPHPKFNPHHYYFPKG